MKNYLILSCLVARALSTHCEPCWNRSVPDRVDGICTSCPIGFKFNTQIPEEDCAPEIEEFCSEHNGTWKTEECACYLDQWPETDLPNQPIWPEENTPTKAKAKEMFNYFVAFLGATTFFSAISVEEVH